MYQTRNSNLTAIASLLVFLAVLHVQAPVLSSPTFVLASAAVDAENPAHIDYSFKTDAQRTVKLIHVNNNTWQIVSLIGIYIELSVDIPCADIHTMISDHVVIDTGDPNRMVVCQFSNAEDAERFYTLIGQNRNPDHIRYGVASVAQLDCVHNTCAGGGPDCNGHSHNVSQGGQINVNLISSPDANGDITKRFVVCGNNGKIQMVFTSKSFNIVWQRKQRNVNAMMIIEFRSLSIKLFVKFKNYGAARGFYSNVTNHRDVNSSIPLLVPDMWRQDLLL